MQLGPVFVGFLNISGNILQPVLLDVLVELQAHQNPGNKNGASRLAIQNAPGDQATIHGLEKPVDADECSSLLAR